MSEQTSQLLADGQTIPQVGLGVWQTPQDLTAMVVKTAIQAGYRHVDTAAIYGNEAGVGEGIRQSGVERKDIFITTKLWNEFQGFDSTLTAFDRSLELLGTDYVDLYLIHWPAPRKDRYVDTWKALTRLKKDGRARSIGVSNFEPEHLDRIIGETGEVPVLNQVELHPLFQQRRLRDVCEKLTIAIESWSPLGQGTLLSHPTITGIAHKHGRTPAQVIIRWHIDSGFIVIPKSQTPERIAQNFDVFGFSLETDDIAAIDALDSPDGRIGPNPNTAAF